jgi:hypothetical protein
MKHPALKPAVAFLLLVALCVVGRLVSQVPNFTPVAAAALFAGFFFRRRWVAACVPVVAMVASDAIIGSYHPGVMATVYAALVFPVLLAGWLSGRGFMLRVAVASLACSTIFFLSTNAAVWLTAYPQTWDGLAACYLAALPFFKYTLSGDLVWSLLLLGGYAWATARASGKAEWFAPATGLQPVANWPQPPALGAAAAVADRAPLPARRRPARGS